MLVYYFVPFIVSNHYLLFWVSNGHNSITVQNRTHVYMNFFHHKDLGNHLLQFCPKVVKHPVDMKMTYCFMLQILDEVFRILQYVEVTPNLSRPYELTVELSDLSTMATEYFKDHIEPLLPEIDLAKDILELIGTFASEYCQFCWWKSALRSVKCTGLCVLSFSLCNSFKSYCGAIHQN